MLGKEQIDSLEGLKGFVGFAAMDEQQMQAFWNSPQEERQKLLDEAERRLEEIQKQGCHSEETFLRMIDEDLGLEINQLPNLIQDQLRECALKGSELGELYEDPDTLPDVKAHLARRIAAISKCVQSLHDGVPADPDFLRQLLSDDGEFYPPACGIYDLLQEIPAIYSLEGLTWEATTLRKNEIGGEYYISNEDEGEDATSFQLWDENNIIGIYIVASTDFTNFKKKAVRNSDGETFAVFDRAAIPTADQIRNVFDLLNREPAWHMRELKKMHRLMGERYLSLPEIVELTQRGDRVEPCPITSSETVQTCLRLLEERGIIARTDHDEYYVVADQSQVLDMLLKTYE